MERRADGAKRQRSEGGAETKKLILLRLQLRRDKKLRPAPEFG
jgi:hypothetical protein